VNLDKCGVTFSKKHIILVRKQLPDFYQIRMRRPINDEKCVV